MLLEEIRNEIWQNLGKPTDLDPSSDTSYNGGPYLTFVANMAQRRVASYKTQREHIMRFNTLKGDMYFKNTIIEGTLESDGTTSTVILPSGDVGAGDDRYNGWVLKINGTYRLIVDYVTSTRTGTLHEDLSTAPATGDTYSLYKKFSYLLPSGHAWVSEHIQLPATTDRYLNDGNFLEILKIEDLDQNRKLVKAKRGRSFVTLQTSTGDPQKWYRYGNKLIFDFAPEEEKWFRMEYYRLPIDMIVDSDEPELPEEFHYALVLWGTEWGYRREGESNEKYSTKLDFKEFMEQTLQELDIADEREFSYGSMRSK
jgi:hypothetical protein